MACQLMVVFLKGKQNRILSYNAQGKHFELKNGPHTIAIFGNRRQGISVVFKHLLQSSLCMDDQLLWGESLSV